MRPAIIGALAAAVVLLAAEGEPDAVPNLVRIPIVKAHGKGDPPDAGLFSHWSHNRFTCYSCHPAVFPQARLGFTHDDMDKGRFCATCHNDKLAWAVDGDVECETCHVEE